MALIGAAVANLACVPLFVHAFTIASPLSVALLRLLGCAVVLILLLPVMRRVVDHARRAVVASAPSGRSASSA